MKRNKILFTFKIQSFSDVITNSSSELFVFDNKGDVEKVKEIINKFHELTNNLESLSQIEAIEKELRLEEELSSLISELYILISTL